MKALMRFAVLLGVSASAAVGVARADAPATFQGSCALSGVVRFQPALSNSARTVTDLATARGTCTGTLTDPAGHHRQLDNAAVGYQAQDRGPGASCGLSIAAMGWGRLSLGSDELAFRLSESRVGPLAALSLTGRTGGSAHGEANINTEANPMGIVEACAGSGLRQAPIDIRLTTTPAISG
jgi:hypothetical protein